MPSGTGRPNASDAPMAISKTASRTRRATRITVAPRPELYQGAPGTATPGLTGRSVAVHVGGVRCPAVRPERPPRDPVHRCVASAAATERATLHRPARHGGA